MALKGRAFIIMWHDITAQGDDDYHQWHTHQHMPERLDHAGFRRSRRGVNRGLDRQTYFTLYEGADLAGFVADDYAHSLNFPTEWTQSIAPHFRNFLRMACEVLETGGRGVGGALVSLRLRLPAGMDEDAGHRALAPALAAINAMPQVTSVHLAAARPDFSEIRTSETELRPPMSEPPFDLVILAECMGLAEASAAQGAMVAAVEQAGFAEPLAQAYDVAYTLEKRDAQ
ncbi:hypothetical protein [Novosphingobium sediminicola]|uniref:EthD domain-containing protein n=1 Tax=Novosphingobium sediminicola TaxID=563162 RepID=A0A7W6CDB4_9SPHN|nr:hypothetical protein [Novosphingobium sediminicola]MBB3954449.1 hypothetical protein [Novosphingobium sediminicola]